MSWCDRSPGRGWLHERFGDLLRRRRARRLSARRHEPRKRASPLIRKPRRLGLELVHDLLEPERRSSSRPSNGPATFVELRRLDTASEHQRERAAPRAVRAGRCPRQPASSESERTGDQPLLDGRPDTSDRGCKEAFDERRQAPRARTASSRNSVAPASRPRAGRFRQRTPRRRRSATPRGRVGAQMLDHVEAALPWHHHVEQHEIRA